MKKRLIIISLLFSLAWSIQAQGVFSIQSVPVCWSIGSIDSSLVANWLISSNQTEPRVLSYLNAVGQAVSVSGGSVSNGYCCCESSGGSTVTATDNGDGTYTIIIDTDTTIIDTRDTLSQNITIGGVTYNAGDYLNSVVIGISNYVQHIGAGEVCGDTLVQAGHGFAVGDLIGQTANNGAYFLANTADADSFPVAAVRTVISVDTFVVCNEGFFSGWTHGRPVGRDYFLQDDGTVDTIPDPDYVVFAFRTFKTDKAYFDVPELIVSAGDSGGGGGGTEDADWYQAGTSSPPLNIEDNIYTNGLVGVKVSNPEEEIHLNGILLFENYYASTIRSKGLLGLGVGNGAGGYGEVIRLARAGSDYFLDFVPTGESKIRIFGSSDLQFQNAQGRVEWRHDPSNSLFTRIYQNADSRLDMYGYQGMVLDGGGLTAAFLLNIPNLPNYASDAAADADATLLSGCVYTVTAEDRTLRIKP